MRNMLILILSLLTSGCTKVVNLEQSGQGRCVLTEASYVLAGAEVSRYFYRYESNGRLKSMLMKYGNTDLNIYYAYSELKIVQTEVDAHGESVVIYDLDPQGRIIKESNGILRREYVYSADGYLIETRDIIGTSAVKSIKYHYTHGNLTRIEYPDRSVELSYNSSLIPSNFDHEVAYPNDRRLTAFLGKRSKNLISKAVTMYYDLAGEDATYTESFDYTLDVKGNILQLRVSGREEKRYEINFRYSCATVE